MTGTAPEARFDDLVAGTSQVFRAPTAVLRAEVPADVVPVLAEVDAASRRGAWAWGFLAYEAAPGLDPGLVTAPPAPDGPPLAFFALGGPPDEGPAVAPPPPAGPSGPWYPDWTPEGHAAGVAAVRERIAAGDVYQVNLTSRVRGRPGDDLLAFYAGLAHAQRTPYAALLDTGRHVVVSASPELFLRWSRDGRLLTRPMKGTAPRGRDPAEDAARARALAASAKERAENVMVVDLLRNDVGRVAAVGSVDVPALCTAERYETVWQLTSDVTGRLAPGVGLVDVFRALFPSASVTGAPKRRAMAVARDLEDAPRGVYCGAVGVVAPPDAPERARFSVAIRTAVVDRATGCAVYGTGSGITWPSDPAAEAAELVAKTAVLTEPHQPFALLETLGSRPGEGPRHLDRHLARLAASADYWGFRCDATAVRRAVLSAVAGVEGQGCEGVRVRVRLDRDGTTTVGLAPLPPPPTGPVRLVVDPEPVSSADRRLQHKTTRREVYERRAARHPGADDVVLVNERGEVTETTVANLAVRLDGVWWTPPTDAGCLPGVERARLLELGRLTERSLTTPDLARAEGLALVSSLRGWRPAVLAERLPGGTD